MLCNDSYKLSKRHAQPVSKVDRTSKMVSYKVKIKQCARNERWGGGGGITLHSFVNQH